jgi:uncharacterized peroxidase-related enzyme
MPAKAWIRMIEPEDATDPFLQRMYELVKTPHGTVDNVMKVHSLRPRTMEGHVVLYRSVLHNEELELPLWFLEVVAFYVSMLNRCAYSLFHHFRNAASLIADEARSAAIREALEARAPERAFDGKELALLRYAEKLTVAVGEMAESDASALRAAGVEDGEILEVNQVCAYFNYSNRLLNGLGVTTAGDRIGYYE